MAVVKQIFARLTKWKRTPNEQVPREMTREENLSRVLGRVEPYVVLLQSVLIWENPTLSALTILGFNLVFWEVANLQVRLFFLICSTTLVVFVYEMWVEKVWPEIRVPLPAEQVDNEDWTPMHPCVLSAPELSHYLNQVAQFAHDHYVWLQNMRQAQPGTFCCLMSTVCLLLMWLGWVVSGTVLLYCVFMSLMLAPGICIHILPSTAHNKLRAWQERLRNPIPKETDTELEEYLPEQTVENLALLQQAFEPDHCDHEEDEFKLSPAELTNEGDITDFGVPSGSFSAGFPEMLGPEDLSLDGTDFSLSLSQQVVAPSRTATSHSTRTGRRNKKRRGSALDIGEIDKDSDSPSGSNEIHFQSLHFNGDSSEEETKEPALRQRQPIGDQSRKGSATGTVAEAAAAVLSYSSAGAINLATLGAAMGQSLISSVINSGSTPVTSSAPVASPTPSSPFEEDEDNLTSDTDDFEMISQEEFDSL